jgi:hypothetical protein
MWKNQAVSFLIAHSLLKKKENNEIGSRPILGKPNYLLYRKYVSKSMSLK